MQIIKKKNKPFEKNNDFLSILGVFFLALILRFVYVFQYQSSPFFFSPIIDALTHVDCARRIAAESNWLLNGNISYPLSVSFLSMIFKLFGCRIFLARIIQVIIGSFSCVLVYILGKKIFNKKIALLAGLICSVYGVLIYFDAEFQSVNLTILSYLMLLILLLETLQRPKSYNWIGVGVLFGISLQLNLSILFFLPFLLIWVIIHFKGQAAKIKPIQQHINKILAVFFIFCGIVVSLLPFTLRSLSGGRGLRLFQSSLGINLYLGNNLEADGKNVITPSYDFIYFDKDWVQDNIFISSVKQVPKLAVYGSNDAAENGFWFNQTIYYILADPLRFLRLMVRKAYYFLNGFEIPNNHSIYAFRSWSSLLKITVFANKLLAFPFGILCPLALIGLFVTPRKEKGVALLKLLILTHFLYMIIFFVCSQFRVVLVPFLALFAASGIYWFVFTFKNKHFARLTVYFVIFVLLFLFCNSQMFNVREDDRSLWFLKIGMAYDNQGEKAKAFKAYKYAYIVNPKNADALYNLGVMLLDEAKYDAAAEKFTKVISLSPNDSAAYNNLGLVFMNENKFAAAVNSFKKALKISPQDMGAWINLATVYAKLGDLEKSLMILNKAKKINAAFPPLLNCLGMVYEAQGQEKEALKFYQKALILEPSYTQAENNYQKLKNRSHAYIYNANSFNKVDPIKGE